MGHVQADETRFKTQRYSWLSMDAARSRYGDCYARRGPFDGLVTSDRFSAYNSHDPKQRRLCWAYIVRNQRSRAAASGHWQADAV